MIRKFDSSLCVSINPHLPEQPTLVTASNECSHNMDRKRVFSMYLEKEMHGKLDDGRRGKIMKGR